MKNIILLTAACVGTASAHTNYYEITPECLAAFRTDSAALKTNAAKVPKWSA